MYGSRPEQPYTEAPAGSQVTQKKETFHGTSGYRPCSQQPNTTGHYPEPDKSSHKQHLFKDSTQCTQLITGLPSGLSPSGFPITLRRHFFYLICMIQSLP